MSADAPGYVIKLGNHKVTAGMIQDDAPCGHLRPFIRRDADREAALKSDEVNAFGFDPSSYSAGPLQPVLYNGMVNDWDDMESLMRQTYADGLAADPNEKPTLLVQPPMIAEEQHAKMAELLFEKFEVPGAFSIYDTTAALFSTGATDGIVLDVGASQSKCVTIANNQTFDDFSVSNPGLGGHLVTRMVTQAMEARGVTAPGSFAGVIKMEEIKEIACLVSTDGTVSGIEPRDVYLPDGNEITVEPEVRHQPTEVLFDPTKAAGLPAVAGAPVPTIGIPQMLRNVVKNLGDGDEAKAFLSKVVLCGNSVPLKGFTTRIESEMKKKFELSTSVTAADKYASWVGGSIFGSAFMEPYLISRADYLEHGAELVGIAMTTFPRQEEEEEGGDDA